MKVLMLGWELPPRANGGLGTACAGIVQGLVRSGVDVTFVVPCVHADEALPGVRLVGCDGRRRRVALERAAGAETSLAIHLVDSPLRPYQSSETYRRERRSPRPSEGFERDFELLGGYGPELHEEVRRYAEVVAALAEDEEFDLVHAHDWMTFPAAIAVGERSRKPVILHVHACELDRSPGRGDERIRRLEQLAFACADRVVCVSHHTADRLRRSYDVPRDKLRVVHNAVRQKLVVTRARERAALQAPIVLFLGRITFQKGPDRFLAAAARVLAVRPDVKFVLSGEGDLLPAMIERAAELGIARQVHFTGHLDPDGVTRMFALADVYVMPSVSEPFGIAALEAMVEGVPVIVPRASGAAEVIRHGLKVDGADIDDVANKILAVLERPALRRELAEEGRREAGRLRWDVRARSLADVYAEVRA